MNVNVKIMNSLCDGVREVVRKAVEECAMSYKFDSEEALSRLGLNEVVVKVEKPVKKVVKAAFPLPFNGMKDESCCDGLKKNHGLYTQCENKRGANEYCKGCSKQALKNESGKPDNGTIEDRLAVGLMEFRDLKGKNPTPYTKIMKKMNLSREQVLEEAGKLNVVVLEEHFIIEEEEKRGRPKTEKVEKVEKEDKKKGRPAKAKKVLEVQEETSDLFAEMIAAASSSTKEEEVVVVEEVKEVEEEDVKEVVVEDVKEVVVEDVKEVVVEDVKEVVKEVVVEDKKAKKEQEKALKEQAKAEAKAKKEQEKALKEQAKSEEKAKKEQEKQEKAVKKGEKKAKEAKPEEEEQDVVKKFEYEGTKYLKSKKTGIVYNMDQDVVGKWDEVTKKIIFEECESDSDEESEDEYDE